MPHQLGALLIFQRNQTPFSAPTLQLTAVCYSSLREPSIIVWSPQAPVCTWYMIIYAGKIPKHIKNKPKPVETLDTWDPETHLIMRYNTSKSIDLRQEPLKLRVTSVYRQTMEERQCSAWPLDASTRCRWVKMIRIKGHSGRWRFYYIDSNLILKTDLLASF